MKKYIELASRLATDKEFRIHLGGIILSRTHDTPTFLNPKGYALKISAALKNIVNRRTSSVV